MKPKSGLPGLESLQPWCGMPANGRWVYQAAVLEPWNKRRPVEEITKLVNKRSVDDLQKQAEEALKQLIARCHCGDEKAIAKFALVVRNAVGSLQELADFQLDKLGAEAETYPRWPLLLSMNKKDGDRARDYLIKLRVGTRTLTPTNPRQKLDPQGFWTRLAAKALAACRINKELVPMLEAHGRAARMERKRRKFWRAVVEATFYTLANGDTIIIADWQKQCVNLPEPVTETNCRDWWAVVRLCVIQHWQSVKADYEAALAQIPDPQKKTSSDEEYHRQGKEHRKRTLALDRLKQGFESLVGCST